MGYKDRITGIWRDAIYKALDAYDTDVVKRGEALDKIANKVVEDALAGSKDAWQEIANRLDGRHGQIVEHSVEGLDFGAILTLIEEAKGEE